MTVQKDRTETLVLAAKELSSSLRLEASPAEASSTLDAVLLGPGPWQGRLPAGPHRVVVTAPGHVRFEEQIDLVPGREKRIRASLVRIDVAAAPSPLHARFFVAASVSPAVMPAFLQYTTIKNRCRLYCQPATTWGGQLTVRGGYREARGFEVGLFVSYLRGEREAPPGWDPKDSVTNSLATSALFTGFTVGFSSRSRFPIHADLAFGLGPVFAGDYPREYNHRESGVYAFLKPGLAVGFPLGQKLEVMFGGDVLLLWSTAPIIRGPFPFVLAPSLGFRHDFQ